MVGTDRRSGSNNPMINVIAYCHPDAGESTVEGTDIIPLAQQKDTKYIYGKLETVTCCYPVMYICMNVSIILEQNRYPSTTNVGHLIGEA